MRINCSSSLLTLAYDAPIKMEICRDHESNAASSSLVCLFWLFTGFVIIISTLKLHNETIIIIKKLLYGVKQGRLSKWGNTGGPL